MKERSARHGARPARHDARTPPRLITPAFLVIAAAALAYFTADGIILPAVPLYVEGPLGGGSVAVGIAVGAFSASALVLRPWAGRLSDRRGRRLPMTLGAGLFAVSVVGYFLAQSVPVLVLMRLLSGVGEAFFFVGAAAAIVDLSPAERRGEAVSFFSLALYAGVGIGPVLGEAVLGEDRFVAVWVLAGAAALVAAALGRIVPETRPQEDDGAPASTRLIHPAALLPGIGILAAVSGMAGFFAFVPLYAPEVGLAGSRFVFLSFSAVVMLIRSFGARLPDLLGARTASRAALSIGAAGLTIMGVWRTAAGLFAGSVVFAVGVALAFPALVALALSSAPSSERGSVLGTFTAFVDLGFGFGPVLLGIVASRFDYPGSFLAAAGVLVAGLALLLSRGLGRRPALP